MFRYLGALLALLCALNVVSSKGAEAKSRWGKDYLPNVELTTQEGQQVRFYDDVIRGKRVVISFIFTSCRDICPLITARMAQIYEQLGEAAGRDVHFVSISIDPVTDTPARLKDHADAFRSDPRWLFLTGKPENINIVRQ
jgi:cytochrome oxidase Cu insertion factor (SCO1/SenC/PrrC family)